MHAARNPIIEEDLATIVSSNLPWSQLFGKTVLISGANGFVAAYRRWKPFSTLTTQRTRKFRLSRWYGTTRRPSAGWAAFSVVLILRSWFKMFAMPTEDRKAVDYIVHAASQASGKFYATDPRGDISSRNVLGTQSMLAVAREARSQAFLFFSSGEVYGQIENPSVGIKETGYGPLDPLSARSCYAEGKRGGETLCVCWHAQFGVPAKVVRLSHTYGPGMELNDGRVFADFVADLVSRRDICLKSDGRARRPFCYLADATVAFPYCCLAKAVAKPTTLEQNLRSQYWILQKCFQWIVSRAAIARSFARTQTLSRNLQSIP